MYTKKIDGHVQKKLDFGRGKRKILYTPIFTCDTRVIYLISQYLNHFRELHHYRLRFTLKYI